MSPTPTAESEKPCSEYIHGKFCCARHCLKCGRHISEGRPLDCSWCSHTSVPSRPPDDRACSICASNGFEWDYAKYNWTAVVRAPQSCLKSESGVLQYMGRSYTMLKICEGHLIGWWDGSDIPEAERPPFQPL